MAEFARFCQRSQVQTSVERTGVLGQRRRRELLRRLNNEMYYWQAFPPWVNSRLAVADYTEIPNRCRLHTTLDYRTPLHDQQPDRPAKILHSSVMG